MTDVGKFNELVILREADCGFFLDGEELGDILLPSRYITPDYEQGDTIRVFVMHDSEDRLVAITDTPLAEADTFACLKVVATNKVGAFLDWGLQKDLLVPFREQAVPMKEGTSYVVRVYQDTISGLMVASSRLDRFLSKSGKDFEPKEKVSLVICHATDLGVNVIVNGTHWGLISHHNIFTPLKYGSEIDGWIGHIREDDKLNIVLQAPGAEKIDGAAASILNHIRNQGGFIPLTDKSPSEDIQDTFGVSKKTYKKAIGSLYKARLVTLEEDGTRLTEGGAAAD